MTREEARKAAEVMMAYADGKEIEFKLKDSENWLLGRKKGILLFNWEDNNYRIKKEPTYRPFNNKEECWEEMKNHQPFGWVCYNSRFINIANIDNKGITYLYGESFDSLDYTNSLRYLKFTDGTPFGIKEE